MLLNQVYYNATDAFQQDPALRELLRSTMDQASVDDEIGLTPPPGIPGGPPRGAIPTAMPQSNVAAKGDLMPTAARDAWETMPQLPARSLPITPEQVGMLEQIQPFGIPGAPPPPPRGAPAPQVSGAAPQYGPRPGGPMPPAAAPAPIPDASRGSSLAAFLSGLGSSDAIIPAIGGGMQAVEQLDRQNTMRNQTLRALINRGLDHDTAMAAVSNPEILKAVLPTLFGTTGGNVEEIYNKDGLPQKVLVGKNGKYTEIGGPKRDTSGSQLTKAQGLANIKRTETFKTDAENARQTMAQLSQLEELRKDVNYEGIPFAEPVAKFLSWSGLGPTIGAESTGGAGGSLFSNAANLQLGFTQLTKGAISDAEMALFGSATPGIKMGDEAAANVIAGMKAGAQRVIERSKFYEKWLSTNHGSLEGAQETWDNYVASNPIIEKVKEGIRVNTKNVGNWKDYVTDVNGAGAASAPAAASEASGVAPGASPRIAPSGAAPGGRPMPQGGMAVSPHDTGEAVPGMMQLKDGTWVVPDPKSPTGYKKWKP